MKIRRRIRSGMDLVMTVVGAVASGAIAVAAIVAVWQLADRLWQSAYFGAQSVLERLGVPTDWAGVVLFVLLLMVIVFVIGFAVDDSGDDDDVEINGIEPGVQDDEEMNEPDVPYRSHPLG